jgi:CHAT domain-containing protein/tetratricopeptide (TPR) repeat protein
LNARLLWWTIVLCAVAARPARAGDHARQWEVVEEAERLRMSGRVEDAVARLDVLERACAGDPMCLAIAAWGRAYHVEVQDPLQARPLYEATLRSFEQLGSAQGEGRAWLGLGWVAMDTGDNARALELLAKARERSHAARDLWGEAEALNDTGVAWSALGQKATAIEYYERAMGLFHEGAFRPGEGMALSNIGKARAWMGERRKAIEAYERALAIRHAENDLSGEAFTLLNLGLVCADLGDRARALGHYEEALTGFRGVGDHTGTARTLAAKGAALAATGERNEALEMYGQALSLFREIGDVRREATTLTSIGAVWYALGEPRKALEFFDQALPIQRRVRDLNGSADTITLSGVAWSLLGDQRRTLALYEEALPIRRSVGDREGEAATLSELARLQFSSSSAQAILHAKQAVNLYQSLRADLQGIGKETERTYAESVSGAYRLLADLLVADGRVLEAQQVMDLLKDDELNRLLRRSAPAGGSVRFSAAERAADDKYRHLGDALAGVEGKLAELRGKKEATPEMKAEISSLEATAAAKREAFAAYFAGLAAGLAKVEAERERTGKEFETIQQFLGDGTVAVYTIFGKDRTTLLVYGRDFVQPRKAALDAKEVARRAFALATALARPGADPREASAKVYEVLVAPIADDLAAAKVKTILWSLDGPLRYVPPAALWDQEKKEWLAQRYENVEITTASLFRLNQQRARRWKALGVGVTTEHGELRALGSVDGELRAVVRDEKNPKGAIPGTRLTNADFTRESFMKQLASGWPVVHVASHYVFHVPEGESDEGSYLLLGDGGRLTLKDLAEVKKPLFGGVDLLALSACQTAVGAEASELSGAEVDGLAMVAQQRGAAGVLATLWPVNDPATAAFMGDLYARLRTGKVTKAEALRQSQLSMIKESTAPRKNGAETRSITSDEAEKREEAHASFPGWSHPYYWAPFILLGNGR